MRIGTGRGAARDRAIPSAALDFAKSELTRRLGQLDSLAMDLASRRVAVSGGFHAQIGDEFAAQNASVGIRSLPRLSSLRIGQMQ
jgi:hypothetical protein